MLRVWGPKGTDTRSRFRHTPPGHFRRVRGAAEAGRPTLDPQRSALRAVSSAQQVTVRPFGPKHTARCPGGVMDYAPHPTAPLGRLTGNLRHYILCFDPDNIAIIAHFPLSN